MERERFKVDEFDARVRFRGQYLGGSEIELYNAIERQPFFSIEVDSDLTLSHGTYNFALKVFLEANKIDLPSPVDSSKCIADQIDEAISKCGSYALKKQLLIEEFDKRFEERRSAQKEAVFAAFKSWADAGFPDVKEWPSSSPSPPGQ